MWPIVLILTMLIPAAVDAQNAPLRHAQILFTAGQLGVRRLTTTDAEGRYEIVELAEGPYNVTASKGGYVTLQYGQRRAFEPGRTVAVAPPLSGL